MNTSDTAAAKPQFLSVAGRWKQHAAILDKSPKREQGLAAMMFFAGFSAGMTACTEVAAFEEDEACRLLDAMHRELECISRIAQTLSVDGMPS